MVTEIEESKGPLDESVLEEHEVQWRFQLPSQYRDFLLTYNGGYPTPDAFDFKDSNTGSCVDRFLGIHGGQHNNLLTYLQNYNERIPNELFPIGHDPGGNLICIGVVGKNLGKVFFWDHEFEAEQGESANYSNITLILKQAKPNRVSCAEVAETHKHTPTGRLEAKPFEDCSRCRVA